MRLCIRLIADRPIFVPWDYLQLLQGFLYHALYSVTPDLAEFLHGEGFEASKHRYKLFTFSKLFPRRARGDQDGLWLYPPLEWRFSSPLPAIVEAIATALVTRGVMKIGREELTVIGVETEPPQNFQGPVLFATLSPLVASTGVRDKGNKLRKVFLSPQDPSFWRIIRENLWRKAEALGRKDLVGREISFEKVGQWRSRLYLSQGTQVKGWEGLFWVEGETELIGVGYEAGFGERNSQGFGMVRVIRTEKVPS